MNIIIKDVVANFKSITKVESKDMFDEEGMKPEMVLKTLDPIRKWVKRHYKTELTDNMLYELDDALFAH